MSSHRPELTFVTFVAFVTFDVGLATQSVASAQEAAPAPSITSAETSAALAPPAAAPPPGPVPPPAPSPVAAPAAAHAPVVTLGAGLDRADEPRPSRAPRILLETLAGGGSAAAGLTVGGMIGASTCGGSSSGSSSGDDYGDDDDSLSGPFDCLGNVFLGVSLGYLIAAPIGTWTAGNGTDGNGSLGAAFLGEAIGVGAGLLVVAAADDGLDGQGGFALLALPLVGTVVGYELSSDASAERAENERAHASLRPTLAVSATGATVGPRRGRPRRGRQHDA